MSIKQSINDTFEAFFPNNAHSQYLAYLGGFIFIALFLLAIVTTIVNFTMMSSPVEALDIVNAAKEVTVQDYKDLLASYQQGTLIVSR